MQGMGYAMHEDPRPNEVVSAGIDFQRTCEPIDALLFTSRAEGLGSCVIRKVNPNFGEGQERLQSTQHPRITRPV